MMENRKKRSFLLRLDPDLWDELQAWSADELRSINGQIEYILREAAKQRRQSRSPAKPCRAVIRDNPRVPGESDSSYKDNPLVFSGTKTRR
jgi:hypothetical protein